MRQWIVRGTPDFIVEAPTYDKAWTLALERAPGTTELVYCSEGYERGPCVECARFDCPKRVAV